MVTMHDGVPDPKVIDFGIAKATEQRLTDKTLFTSYAQLMGTPAYMSPEQMELSGLNLDTRSDIYSLGVLLYELLTGRTPFDTGDLLKLGVDELRRTVCEQEPLSPIGQAPNAEQRGVDQDSQKASGRSAPARISTPR
jgi:serine/threonine protein kinase